jgi:hypothetical protein
MMNDGHDRFTIAFLHMAGSLGSARAGTAAGLRWLVGGKACHDHVKRQTDIP